MIFSGMFPDALTSTFAGCWCVHNSGLSTHNPKTHKGCVHNPKLCTQSTRGQLDVSGEAGVQFLTHQQTRGLFAHCDGAMKSSL